MIHLILMVQEPMIWQRGNDSKQVESGLLEVIQLLRKQSRLVQVERGHHQGPFHHLLILLPLTVVFKEMIKVKWEKLLQYFHQTMLGLKA